MAKYKLKVKDQRDISLKELKELATKVLSKDWYPKELPNGMYEIVKGCFTNKKGLEKFYEVFDKK